ncbi:hypothetical protein BU23DRAFT_490480 [Bimuria novae-zelandiae CBS 107.79]|uniref:Uncharacterized protein n=1 Tax=Bimuria novae-zelandiae CBS 107.79 TaxID=1447943 RepID=A0A6A5UK47_9PLEO|nr:hypothetical protein BU23DRAFT_490480 [Bimuria novae-zelandiae CBS 107.79]
MLIIRRFSLVVLSFTRHSYREYKSVQITKGTAGRLRRSIIIYRILKANTLRVTRLYFVKL